MIRSLENTGDKTWSRLSSITSELQRNRASHDHWLASGSSWPAATWTKPERFAIGLCAPLRGNPGDLQIMYNIFGGRRLTEFELDWLTGYESWKPVRVGNAASGQFQLDVYGGCVSCWYMPRKMGLQKRDEGWHLLKGLIAFMEDAWQHPDDGTWEVRGGRRHFTHSKVMAWVFFDRVAKAIQEFGFGRDEGRKMLPRICSLRDRIHMEVCERGFSPRSERSRNPMAAKLSMPVC